MKYAEDGIRWVNDVNDKGVEGFRFSQHAACY